MLHVIAFVSLKFYRPTGFLDFVKRRTSCVPSKTFIHHYALITA